MKRFHFPFDYKPKVSLQDTLHYANLLKQKIFNFLQEQYKAIYLDPALIVSNKESSLSYTNLDRYVGFDNKVINMIAAFNNCQDNYLTLASSKFKHKNIFTYCPSIKRDAKLTNTSSMINWMINIELAMPDDNLNIEYFSQFAKDTFAKIATLTQAKDLENIFEVDKKKIKSNQWKTFEAQKLEDGYPTLNLSQSLKHICSAHKFVIVQNNLKRLKSNNSVEQYVATGQDLDCSCGLYVYDFVNDAAINLINICKRPSGQKSFDQLKNINPLELDNQIYDKQLFDQDRPTNMSISINFTNLLFYLLDKVHLAEVVSSIWPDEFIEFIKTEKVDIL